ncbi:MAG TPA: hypothetical protein VHZ03_21290 [Trebonia sp.]|nr:hypothetical protein [Trebonia sp.]
MPEASITAPFTGAQVPLGSFACPFPEKVSLVPAQTTGFAGDTLNVTVAGAAMASTFRSEATVPP